MVSVWILIASIVGAFSLGALFMAIIQVSSKHDRTARWRTRSFDGFHPLDSPSQV
jgi:Na+-transporting NADH:ubiquinone oxidoreductase subunit NqrB